MILKNIALDGHLITLKYFNKYEYNRINIFDLTLQVFSAYSYKTHCYKNELKIMSTISI